MLCLKNLTKVHILSLIPLTLASVVPIPVGRRASATPASITAQQIDSQFVRPAHFTQISYCSPDAVKSWKCGGPCEATPGVEVLMAGGDNMLVPRYFVAHDPTTKSIVVAHQGTDRHNVLSVVNDILLDLTPLDKTRIPGAPGDVLVHDGFQQTFSRTADEILKGVRQALADKKVNNVLVVGHSLGAAVATMDAMMLKKNLNSSVNINTVVFGLPRGGNSAWADFVGSEIGNSFKYITNQKDPVPRLPPQFLGFEQPPGEVFIRNVDAKGEATDVVDCPGQENTNCEDGNPIFAVNIDNHLGPYFRNITFGGKACSS